MVDALYETAAFLGFLALKLLRVVLYGLMGAALLMGLLFTVLWLFTFRPNLPPFIGASVATLVVGFLIARASLRLEYALLARLDRVAAR